MTFTPAINLAIVQPAQSRSRWGSTEGGYESGPSFGMAMAPLIQALAENGEPAEAIELATRFIESAPHRGLPTDVFLGRWALAHVLLLTGRLDEAEGEARAACRGLAPIDLDRTCAQVTLAEILLRRGKIDEALALGRALVAECERPGAIRFKAAHARLVVAEALLASGPASAEEAQAMLARQADQLIAYAASLPDPYQRTFLEGVRENARILELALPRP